jgi:primosomal protein N'
MFGIKKMLTEKLMERQLKNLPPAQREAIMAAVSANPDFFEKMAKEIEAEKKSGKNEMAASMEVMRKHQSELQKIMLGK